MKDTLASIGNSYSKAKLAVVLLLASVFMSASIVPATADNDGQVLFQQKCASCHSIGQGRRAGPDLQGVISRRDKNWLAQAISAPDQLLSQGDATAKQLVQEYGMPMPNLAISAKDAETLIAYLDAASGASSAESPSATKDAAEKPAVVAGDPAIGRALFTGEVAFTNGGVACISCHNADGIGVLGGGSIARDLTTVYANLGQDGLRSLLTSNPFPFMKEAFASHPLTDSEVANLVSFLQQESTATVVAPAPSPYLFLMVAVVVFFVALGLIYVIWMGRLQGVRMPLLKGGSK